MGWGAAIGAVGSYLAAREANSNARRNSTQSSSSNASPWYPSELFRIAGMRGAYDLLGGQYSSNSRGQVGPTGTFNWSYGQPGYGQGVAGSTPATGGGGGGGSANYTTTLMQGLSDRAQAGHPLYGPANAFATSMLSGGEQNPYRVGAASAYAGLENDPSLNNWMNFLYSGDLSGLGGSGGSGGSLHYGGGGGGGVGSGPIGIENYIRDILNGEGMQDNPYRDQMLAGVERDVSNAFNRTTLPGINSSFAGAGAFGSSMYERALGQAAGEYTSNLADALGGIRYNEYEARMADKAAALGLGTQYDLGVIDANQRAAAAASSAGASAYSADRAAQTQLQLARLGALGDAVGMGVNLRQAGAEGLGGLAQLYSSDMMGTLGMIPDLSGLDIRDYSTALDHAQAIDQARRSAAGQNAQLQWDRERYYREAPMTDLMRYADIINSMSGGYGFSTGTQTLPYNSVNALAQAAMGGLAGWYAGQSYRTGGNSNNTTVNTP